MALINKNYILGHKWFKLINSLTFKHHSFYPLYVDHHITYKCNGSCYFCYLKSNEVDENRADEIISYTKKLGYLEHVTISGGEPFLSADLVNIIRSYVQYNRCRNFSIITNGSFPDKIVKSVLDIIELHHNIKVMILISIDDIGVRHDQVRKVASLSEKIEETIRELKKNKASNLSIGSVTCIHPGNQGRIEEIRDYLGEYNLDAISFNIARNDQGTPLISYLDFSYLIARANNFADYVQLKYMDKILNKGKTMKCFAGSLKIMINSRGDVLPCELIRERKLRKCHCSLECQIWMNAVHNLGSFCTLLVFRISFFFSKK